MCDWRDNHEFDRPKISHTHPCAKSFGQEPPVGVTALCWSTNRFWPSRWYSQECKKILWWHRSSISGRMTPLCMCMHTSPSPPQTAMCSSTVHSAQVPELLRQNHLWFYFTDCSGVTPGLLHLTLPVVNCSPDNFSYYQSLPKIGCQTQIHGWRLNNKCLESHLLRLLSVCSSWLCAHQPVDDYNWQESRSIKNL